MNPQLFLAFVLVSVTLVCVPGMDWAYSIAAGLRQRSFVPAIAGLCSGYVLHTALMVAGLAALLAAVPGLLGWLTVAGAAYLIWLGVVTMRSWRDAAFAVSDMGQAPQVGVIHVKRTLRGDQLRWFLRGVGTSGINPKALLFFVALVPQFISAEAPMPAPIQSAVLGATYIAIAGAIYTGVALGSRKLLGSKPAAARVVTLASGILMLLLGVVLLAEQLLPPLLQR